MINKIGIFDSGVGGLTVLEELTQYINTHYIYFGDTKRAPWGSKTKEELWSILQDIKDIFNPLNLDLIITGCNTTYAVFKDQLTQLFETPVLNLIESSCEKAISLSQTKSIGVLATERTIQSNIYQDEIMNQTKNLKDGIGIACPKLVPLIEKNQLSGKNIKDHCTEYLKELQNQDVDTIIYGCTHFPYLDHVFKLISPDVNFINPATTIIEKLKPYQQNKSIQSSVELYINGEPNQVMQFIKENTNLKNTITTKTTY